VFAVFEAEGEGSVIDALSRWLVNSIRFLYLGNICRRLPY
jgi:hypothetical protein